eukprot:2510957-Alexandrium_andersonii.AAC.1
MGGNNSVPTLPTVSSACLGGRRLPGHPLLCGNPPRPRPCLSRLSRMPKVPVGGSNAGRRSPPGQS